MSNDRELLELAAKAYWGAEIDDTCSVRWSENDNAIVYMHGDNQDHNGCDVELVWNPLDFNYDTFSLMVKLEIATVLGDNHAICGQWSLPVDVKEPYGDDPCAAARRAIVRAAAEIWRATQ